MFSKYEFETDIERLLRKSLERKGLTEGSDFYIQHPVKGGYILDFAFPDKMICVEADGDPFHSGEKARKRDAIKNFILKKKGWKVLRFWGSEIYEDVDACVQKIVEYL